MRKQVLKMDNNICKYCSGKANLATGHNPSVKQHYYTRGFGMSPKARKAWANNPNILRAACRSCNSSKGSKHFPTQWRLRF